MVLLLGVYPKKKKKPKMNSKKYLHPHMHWSIIYNSQDMESTYVHQQMHG